MAVSTAAWTLGMDCVTHIRMHRCRMHRSSSSMPAAAQGLVDTLSWHATSGMQLQSTQGLVIGHYNSPMSASNRASSRVLAVSNQGNLTGDTFSVLWSVLMLFAM